jgi:hypothetical protein
MISGEVSWYTEDTTISASIRGNYLYSVTYGLHVSSGLMYPQT